MLGRRLPLRTATLVAVMWLAKSLEDFKWNKVFKNGPSKICGGQSLKAYIFKGCLPQILLGPFLNTLPNHSLADHLEK